MCFFLFIFRVFTDCALVYKMIKPSGTLRVAYFYGVYFS